MNDRQRQDCNVANDRTDSNVPQSARVPVIVMNRHIHTRIIVLMIAAVLLPSCAPKLLPQPLGEIDRPTVIDYYLQGDLEAIEGVWIWPDSRYEIAIVAHDYEAQMKRPGAEATTLIYDYVGVVTETRVDNWRQGEIKLLLKRTADPTLFIGDILWEGKGTVTMTARLLSRSGLQITPTDSYFSRSGLTLVRTHPSAGTSDTHPGSVARTPAGNSDVVLKSTGTGFFVADGTVVTNYHVIEGATKVEVSWGQTTAEATIAVRDKANDLALLTVTPSGLAPDPLPVGVVRDIAEGEAVMTIGYPLSGVLGDRPRITDGIISSATGLDDDPRVCQITVPVQPGNSGGPLLNSRGEVIGVVTSSLNDLYFLERNSTVPQNVNFAIKINYVNNLLQLLPAPRETVSSGRTLSISPAEIMEQSRKSVVHVLNYQ
jgi:S1-C subfamily serine protease